MHKNKRMRNIPNYIFDYIFKLIKTIILGNYINL